MVQVQRALTFRIEQAFFLDHMLQVPDPTAAPPTRQLSKSVPQHRSAWSMFQFCSLLTFLHSLSFKIRAPSPMNLKWRVTNRL
jgi:hypothetical protein